MGLLYSGPRGGKSLMTRVSVVIPCYNSGNTIEQTINSTLAQTWPDVEIVVIDDGSSDPLTIDVLNRQTHVTLIRQANAGLPAARNAGMAAASGDFLLPLDADDWLEPSAVQSMMESLHRNPDAAFAYSHLQLEGEARGVLVKSFNFFEQLFFNQMPYCLLMPASLWRDVGGYEEGMRRGYEDWEFNIRIGLRGYWGVVVPQPLFHYRVSSSGMLISQSNQLHGALWDEIQRKHPDAYRLISLFRRWREWRRKPSTYPLWAYFPWLIFHRIASPKMFSWVFNKLRARSHSRRVTAAAPD